MVIKLQDSALLHYEFYVSKNFPWLDSKQFLLGITYHPYLHIWKVAFET